MGARYKQVQQLIAQMDRQADESYRELSAERERHEKQRQELSETIEQLSTQLEAKIQSARAAETELSLVSKELKEQIACNVWSDFEERTLWALKDDNALLNATNINKNVQLEEKIVTIERLRNEKENQLEKFQESETSICIIFSKTWK